MSSTQPNDSEECCRGSGGGGGSQREEMEKLFFVLLKRQQMQEVVRMLGAEFCCPVCQNLVSLATLASCGHMFCQKCIRTWCVDYGRRNCPVCRVHIQARIRAQQVDRLIRRCLEEANDKEALRELLQATAAAGDASVFVSDRAPVRSTSANFYGSSYANSGNTGGGGGGGSGTSVVVRSTSATSAAGSVASFGVSSD